jgi:4'-phosphopantetheinyl transferase
MERLDRFRFPRRRSEWLLGRFTAKSLAARELGARRGRPVSLAEIEIVPEASGAPSVREVRAPGPLPISISLSHSSDRAMAALLFTDLPGAARSAVGVDLERVTPRPAGFVRDFLTPAERAEVGASPEPGRALLANGIWSAKEAVLKALKLGLTVDTWKVECQLSPGELPPPPEGLSPCESPWRRFSVRCAPEILPAALHEPELLGWWREDAGYVLTLAVMRCSGEG